MDTKIVKREALKINGRVWLLADICAVAQKDGDGTGYTVGILEGKPDSNGGTKKRCFIPFAEALLHAVGRVVCTNFNEYTKVWKDERRAAEAVRKLCGKYNLTEGQRTTDALAMEAPEKEKKVVRSDFERIASVVDKMMSRDKSKMTPAVMVDTLLKVAEALMPAKDAEAAEVLAAIIKARDVAVATREEEKKQAKATK